MNARCCLPGVLLAVLFAAGCTSPPSLPFLHRHSAKVATIDNPARFIVLGKPTPPAVSCTGLQERMLPDGRLEVVVNLRNGEARPLDLLVTCVFKDDHGTELGGPAPGEKLALPEGATRVLKFAAASDQARDYTIRVSPAR